MSLEKKTKKELIAIIEATKDDAYREWLNIGKVCNSSTISVIALALICFGLIIAHFWDADNKFLVCSRDKTILPEKNYSKLLNSFSSNNSDSGADFSLHSADIWFCGVLKDDEK